MGIALRNLSSRSHGFSFKSCKRHQMLRPHISKEKLSLNTSAVLEAIFIISLVRTRVAKSDWCASRKVVSVTNTSFCSRTQSATALGPLLSSAVSFRSRY